VLRPAPDMPVMMTIAGTAGSGSAGMSAVMTHLPH
jgi:hypothetical protein